ncbi:hypothetical protein [Breznakiella homolactica]|uniref:Uncharacterized protein n=1 Tax=Breznakiella homolactica TaxID=2798577 RepID=A0A7T8BB27_9SPIR|nr:hypothetical protein [Breznakiella homolactica]QQO08793.1 hypothetical protein JFL75_17970 [Breznakiella homolactica]
MIRKISVIAVLIIFAGGFAAAQELKIDYRFNTARTDSANYLTFQGPVRYAGVEADTFDSVSGASKSRSTAFFSPYLMDMYGRPVFSGGLRGVLLFAVAPPAMRTDDNLTAEKASDGTITIQYVHRGTAYKITTDKNGKLGFPRGGFSMRTIGYIQGAGPQVLSREFSSDGTAAAADWKKIWDPGIPGGKEITPGISARTGIIVSDSGDPQAMFNWDGTLQVTLEQNILKISGTLRPVKR